MGDEFIETFILMFAGTAVAIANKITNKSEILIGCAVVTGLAVMVINPAVTISFPTLKHFPWKNVRTHDIYMACMEVPMYIGAQILASVCAAFALKGVYHPFMGGGVTIPSEGYSQAFVLEFIISFNLMFVVTAFATPTLKFDNKHDIKVDAEL
ncbi:hypothetical protein HN51_010561 [Arachis hypogaea]